MRDRSRGPVACGQLTVDDAGFADFQVFSSASGAPCSESEVCCAPDGRVGELVFTPAAQHNWSAKAAGKRLRLSESLRLSHVRNSPVARTPAMRKKKIPTHP